MAAAPNARRSVDFAHDPLADGRRLRVADVVDDVTKGRPAAVVDASVPGRRVARELAAVVARRGEPDPIVGGRGAAFASNAGPRRTQAAGVARHFLAPDEPTRNGVREAFDARTRDALPNETLFLGLDPARAATARRVADRDRRRPRPAPASTTPAAHAAQLTAIGDRLSETEALRRSPTAPSARPRPFDRRPPTSAG